MFILVKFKKLSYFSVKNKWISNATYLFL